MYIPLHVHSQYSVLDSPSALEDIVATCVERGFFACALTDHGNLFGAVDFYKECKKAKLKSIIGCDCAITLGPRAEKRRNQKGRNAYNLTLLVKNAKGYKNLCKLITAAHLEGFYYVPRIDKEILSQHKEGLICLTGSLGGLMPTLAVEDKVAFFQELEFLHGLFGEDLYCEVSRHAMRQEDIVADGIEAESFLIALYNEYLTKQNAANELIIQEAKKQKIPIVATNDEHYIQREDWQAHEILLNVSSGEACELYDATTKQTRKNPKRSVYWTHELYFKTTEQMQALFCDLPEAIEETKKVADKCSFAFDFETKHYPIFVPPNASTARDFLVELCESKIPVKYTQKRLAAVFEKMPGKDPLAVVSERLSYEISILGPKGLCDYLLIVRDFIQWARDRGIPVGPGRGSGAGSIVCYLLGITDIEPLRFNLLFERFINPERLSYPDLDIDICMDRRQEVIDYMVKKYGQDNVAQIITFGTMKAKMALKDVGRVLSIPLSKVNDICKGVPEDPNMTIEKALSIDPDFKNVYTTDPVATRLIDIAKQLEGSIRNTGVHAAGLIVSGSPLVEYLPLCRAKDSDMALTQYAMKPVEAIGMLKMDFLGLKTLTSIQKAVDSCKKDGVADIDWQDIPLDDEQTFALLNQGHTEGVFQLESGGMQELAKNLHIDRFEELIAVVSLYRPGPMEMIPSYIGRKFGKEAIEEEHPWLKNILSETYGIMVYQEQVMQIASSLASFSLGEGDVLRKAMGKKDMAQMHTMREKFRLGALKNDIDEATSMKIFDKMEKFAAYGFNKSHAAAYAYLSYVTAYLKAHFPTHWLAALMSSDGDDIEKVSKIIREAQNIGVSVLPPDVNSPGLEFVPTKEGIRFAMSAIKGIGEGLVDAIVKERKQGPFKSLYDFISRVDKKKVGKKSIEHLIYAGCLDFCGWSRDAMAQSVEMMFDAAQKEQADRDSGALSLFALYGDDDGSFSKAPIVQKPLSLVDLMMKEKELLGFFVSGHPLKTYREWCEKLFCIDLARAQSLDKESVFRCAFIIEKVTVRLSVKTQKKFAICVISDGQTRCELPVWSDMYEKYIDLLLDNQLIFAVCQVQERGGIGLKWMASLQEVNEAKIAECDAAFDRAKQKNPYQKKIRTSHEQVLSPTATITLNIDFDTIRMSQLLAFKELLAGAGGADTLELLCNAQGKTLAKIVSSLKVDATKLKDLPSCICPF